MTRTSLRTALVCFFALALGVGLAAAQEMPGLGAPTALARQSLRPYWHVFIAYSIVILLVAGWAGSIAKRLGEVERRLGD
jgi:hypothetical protein